MKKRTKTWNLRTKIITALRKIWRNSPLRTAALQNACVDPSKPVRYRTYKCSNCGKDYLIQLIDVDHIVSNQNKTVSYDTWIETIFLGVKTINIKDGKHTIDNVDLNDFVKNHLQVLCVHCHREKTKKGTL